jgi:benzoyl-CoA reductase subunit C
MEARMSRTAIVDWARAQYEDLSFGRSRAWVADGGKTIGHLPVYAPKEIVHATGMLPIGVHGGGSLEIIRGDAYYQSYICHLPRSTIELELSGRLNHVSGMLFPSTCDVIRNLSGMWQLLRPELYVRYVDLPQVTDPRTGGAFWAEELRSLYEELAAVAGTEATDDALRASLATYNEARAIVRELYAVRRARPWSIPTEELYLLLRAGEVVPVAEFMTEARRYLAAVEADPGRPRDNSRVVVVGAFCEQPPLGLIKTIERAGCYIVDDDFLLGNRLVDAEVPLTGDPIEAFAQTFLGHARKCSILYEQDPGGKEQLMAERVKAAAAHGIIFAAPSFCDPALLDRPMLKRGAESAGIPCIAFKYSEDSGQFQQFREQAGTFSDSIKLWGGTS